MKFGILQFFSWPDRRVDLPVVYQRALDRIEIMDRSGYDAVWLTEHHFSDYSVCPSIPVMGAHAAARTTRLRIGAAVTLAALYHPLRLAEEIALLDVLSGGRVNWGAGRGFDLREFRTFAVAPQESHARFRESVDVVMRAWTNQRVSHRGKYFSFEEVEVLPKPIQKPHPPTWLGASSVDSIKAAAADGFSILMTPHSTHEEIGEHRRIYREELERHGYSIEGREIPVTRLLAIADTDREAAEIAREGARWLLRTYVDPKWSGSGSENVDLLQRYVDSVVIHGTPERVVDQIRRMREEIGLEYLIGAPLSHQTFLHFTDRVLPVLA